MLRTNLSTRPFYNERLVALVLGIAALVVLALSILNVSQLVGLSQSNTMLGAEIEQQQRHAADLRQKAARASASIDPTRLDEVSRAAHEANQLIDRRTFSWTELFNGFEKTLPPEVRIAAVKPGVDGQGRLLVTMSVVARSVADIEQFMEALEKTGTWGALLAREERTNDEDLLEATLQGVYLPAGRQVTAVKGGGR
jgi:Tfp pilus assembly protein PilN